MTPSCLGAYTFQNVRASTPTPVHDHKPPEIHGKPPFLVNSGDIFSKRPDVFSFKVLAAFSSVVVYPGLAAMGELGSGDAN